MANLQKPDFRSDYALPDHGMEREALRKRLDDAVAKDPESRFARMAIYSMKGSDAVQDVLLEAFGKVFHKNNLVAAMLPGMLEIEQELLSMATRLLSGGVEGPVVNFTSGGTESIFCAIHAARQWARETKPHIKTPEFVVPYSAHATLGKAGRYLDVKIVRVPVGADYRADIEAIKAQIGPNTIGLYASAPNWPYGTYDRVREFGEVALERDLWLHVDACVGGFMAPFAKELGYSIPDWDFSVPGVTSISADLHKYAYAMKPASVIAWRDASLQKYHYVKVSYWPTMEYSAEGFVGSRSAGPVAAAWAVMHFLGRDGYLDYTAKTMANKQALMEGIGAIEGLEVIDNELCILCYVSNDVALPIEMVLGALTERGWIHFGTMEPPMIQLILDPLEDGIIDAYLSDLAEIVAQIRSGHRFVQGEMTYAR